MARPRDTAAAKKARGTYRADRDPDAVRAAAPAPECIQSDRAPLPEDVDLAGWGAMLRLIPGYDPYALAGDAVFDAARAREAIDFIETRVVHIKGELARHTFVLEPWQRAVVANMFGWVRPDGTRRFREVLVYIGKKAGKALDVDTPIPTPAGWKRMGELVAGDRVYDEDGLPCTVVAAGEVQRDRPCYRVTFSDATAIVADAEHEWAVCPRVGHTKFPLLRTTQQICDSLLAPDGYAAWYVDDLTDDGQDRMHGEYRRLGGVGAIVTGECPRLIVAVDPVPSRPVRCIHVDSPSHLYLAGPGMVPTHNSALVMALTLYLFVADEEPGAEVYCAAAKREQARIIWDQCKLELARIDPDEQIAQRYQHSIVRPDGGFLKPISADAGTEDGMNPHAVVLDELHRQPDADLVDVCRLSTAARRQPLFIMLTTADEDRESVCNDTLARAKAVRDNPGDPLRPGFDASFLPVIYEADPEDDWTSPATWRKANPSIGVTVKEEWIARECELAKENPAQEIPFKRYFCNMRTRGSKKWLDLAAWDRCGAKFRAEDLHGAECIAGLDLSSTTDITALVLYFPATRHVLPWFWVPEDAAKQRDKRNDAIYMRWSRAGLLTLTSGDQLDDERVLNEMEDAVRPFKVREVAIDPWNSLRYTQPLMKRGYNVVQVRQGTYTMNEPLKEIGRLISRRELQHGGHPVLRWMAGNAEIEQDRKGNFALVKPRGGDKIDGMAALATAMARAIVIAPDGGSSVYEERGPIVV